MYPSSGLALLQGLPFFRAENILPFFRAKSINFQ
jgi:hypothetical protein